MPYTFTDRFVFKIDSTSEPQLGLDTEGRTPPQRLGQTTVYPSPICITILYPITSQVTGFEYCVPHSLFKLLMPSSNCCLIQLVCTRLHYWSLVVVPDHGPGYVPVPHRQNFEMWMSIFFLSKKNDTSFKKTVASS